MNSLEKIKISGIEVGKWESAFSLRRSAPFEAVFCQILPRLPFWQISQHSALPAFSKVQAGQAQVSIHRQLTAPRKKVRSLEEIPPRGPRGTKTAGKPREGTKNRGVEAEMLVEVRIKNPDRDDTNVIFLFVNACSLGMAILLLQESFPSATLEYGKKSWKLVVLSENSEFHSYANPCVNSASNCLFPDLWPPYVSSSVLHKLVF